MNKIGLIGAVAMLASVTAATANHPAFRENTERWYAQMVVKDANGEETGLHYIGETWSTQDLCQTALKSELIKSLMELTAKQVDGTTSVAFCGRGSWQDRPVLTPVP